MASADLRAKIDAWVREDRNNDNHGSGPALQLNSFLSTQRRALIFVALPEALRKGSLVQSATLDLYLKGTGWAGGPWNIRVTRITSRWREGRVTWNTRPATTTLNMVNKTVTDGVDGQLVTFNVANMVSVITSLEQVFYGFQIELTTASSTTRKLHSSDSARLEYHPTLHLTWTSRPETPADLRPSGDRIIGALKPRLMWAYKDRFGDSSQQALEVQIATDPARESSEEFVAGNIVYDSERVASTDAELDLARNLLTADQSSLEASLNGWSATLNASVLRVSTSGAAKHGAWALELKSSAAGDMAARTNFGTSGRPVVAGETYAASVHVRTVLATYRQVRASIFFYNSSGNLLIEAIGAGLTESGSAHANPNVIAVAPTGAAFAAVGVTVLATGGANEAHWVDAAMLAKGATVPTFQPAFDGVPENTPRYWIVALDNSDGRRSYWSDVAGFTRKSLGSLTMSVPPAGTPSTVEETTPSVTWSFTGRPQESIELELFEKNTAGKWTSRFRLDREAYLNSSFSLPNGLLRREDVDDYKIRLTVWDTEEREEMPGDAGSVTIERIFRLVRSAVPAAVTTLTATATVKGGVTLDWSRAARPDYFALYIDGVLIEDRIEPDEVETAPGATTYRATTYRHRPTTQHTYEVAAVTLDAGKLKHSQANATAEQTPVPIGAWLIAEEVGLEVCIMEIDEPSLEIGESGETFYVLGSRAPIRETDSVRGYEGSVSGKLVAFEGVSGKVYKERLERLKGLANTVETRLVTAEHSILVDLGRCAPRESRTYVDTWMVDVEVTQVGDFGFDVIE